MTQRRMEDTHNVQGISEKGAAGKLKRWTTSTSQLESTKADYTPADKIVSIEYLKNDGVHCTPL